MNLAKTDAGVRMLKDRRGGLTPLQRRALILCDGQRSLEDLLAATSPGGVTRADIDRLLEMGLVAEQGDPSVSAPMPLGPSERERYLMAYPMATQLTADLGSHGESLHLAVEAAGSLKELQALAPRIRAAVGPTRFARLEPLLRG